MEPERALAHAGGMLLVAVGIRLLGARWPKWNYLAHFAIFATACATLVGILGLTYPRAMTQSSPGTGVLSLFLLGILYVVILTVVTNVAGALVGFSGSVSVPSTPSVGVSLSRPSLSDPREWEVDISQLTIGNWRLDIGTDQEDHQSE